MFFGVCIYVVHIEIAKHLIIQNEVTNTYVLPKMNQYKNNTIIFCSYTEKLIRPVIQKLKKEMEYITNHHKDTSTPKPTSQQREINNQPLASLHKN
jgi:hypothetical protein